MNTLEMLPTDENIIDRNKDLIFFYKFLNRCFFQFHRM